MKPGRALATALLRAPLDSYSGSLYRVVDAQFLFALSPGRQPRPLFDLGPPVSGGRFTPRGGAPSLYLATDVETSYRERFGIVHPRALAPAANQPAVVTFVVNAELRAVLDVTDPEVTQLLGTNPDELAGPWRHRRDGKVPPTHRLGEAAARTGHIDAIRFQSTKGPGHCVMVLTQHLTGTSFVEVRDPSSGLKERIPPAEA